MNEPGTYDITGQAVYYFADQDDRREQTVGPVTIDARSPDESESNSGESGSGPSDSGPDDSGPGVSDRSDAESGDSESGDSESDDVFRAESDSQVPGFGVAHAAAAALFAVAWCYRRAS